MYLHMVNVAHELKTIMEEQKLTVGQVSVKTGVKTGTLYKILSGDRPNPTTETRKMLAEGLGVPLRRFVDEDEQRRHTINDGTGRYQAAGIVEEVTVSMPITIELRLRRDAEKAGMSFSEYLSAILRDHLDENNL